MKHYVIIGNGIAAIGCIEGIRRISPEGRITVISAENHLIYGRPLISYYLEGKTDLEKMKYRPDNFYEANSCDVLYGRKAVSIDAASKKVTLDDGAVLCYDELCCASGSSPFVPPLEGLESVKNKCTFMTLDDALALEKLVAKNTRVLIVGAGLIGLKCAEGIANRAGDITVCDLAPRVLSSILDDTCAGIVQKKLEDNGIRFLLGDSVAKFNINKAYMKSGAAVDFDVLVLAVGVRPNTAIIKNAGGEVNRGIITDTRMKTNLPCVYAAGDCVESYDVSYGSRRILAILPNAYLQGECAGVNMAGGDLEFGNAVPMNSIGFFGLHVATAGSYFGPAEGGELYEETSGGGIKRLFSKDGYLTGFIIIGDTSRAGIYTSLIRNKIKLDSIDFELIKKQPAMAAFSKEYRGKTLGGVV